MKLTERQKALRIMFRAHVIDKWADPATSFYSIFSSMIDGTEVTVAEIRRELSEIPSIGFIDWGWSVRPWLARHYPMVSDALFDTADKRIAMTLFVAKNYVNGKSALAEIKASAKRSEKKINEIRTLNSEKRHRWAKSDWTVCK